jgi:hypothetical protein
VEEVERGFRGHWVVARQPPRSYGAGNV